jgi:DMSO/TMAO reductase YedYZ molybdopterin-dependent catalytic subunit
MKKASKIALLIFILLIVAAVPLYYYTRPPAVPASTQPNTIQIEGNVSNPMNITLSQLETFPALTIKVTLTSGATPSENGVFNYTGVLLGTLLNQAKASSNATSVYVEGSDGYGATVSMQDAASRSTIIAYAKDGAPLTPLKSGGEGPARLIVGTDIYAIRWVKGVVLIQVN